MDIKDEDRDEARLMHMVKDMRETRKSDSGVLYVEAKKVVEKFTGSSTSRW